MAKKIKEIKNAVDSKDFTTKELKQIENSFDGLIGMLCGQGVQGIGQTISQTSTLYNNLRW